MILVKKETVGYSTSFSGSVLMTVGKSTNDNIEYDNSVGNWYLCMAKYFYDLELLPPSWGFAYDIVDFSCT